MEAKKHYIFPCIEVYRANTSDELMDTLGKFSLQNEEADFVGAKGQSGFGDDDDETGQNTFRNLWDD